MAPKASVAGWRLEPGRREPEANSPHLHVVSEKAAFRAAFSFAMDARPDLACVASAHALDSSDRKLIK